MYCCPVAVSCIVLYLYFYIALLALHTNQKRFQCKRPREKRAVLRERKEAIGSPVYKVDRTNQKRFQCKRPREKRAVLRERKEAIGSPVYKVDRIEGRSWFQNEGTMIAKAYV